MSELDDKLRTVLDEFTVKPLPKDKYYLRGQDYIIEQIKQAFADESYIQIKLSSGTKVTGNMNLMTGQEWYERFEKEVEVMTPHYLPELQGKGIIYWAPHEVYNAAKRASGLPQ